MTIPEAIRHLHSLAHYGLGSEETEAVIFAAAFLSVFAEALEDVAP